MIKKKIKEFSQMGSKHYSILFKNKQYFGTSASQVLVPQRCGGISTAWHTRSLVQEVLPGLRKYLVSEPVN